MNEMEQKGSNQPRRQLGEVLSFIYQRIKQDPGTEWSAEDRQLQMDMFFQIYTIVSKLLSCGHFVKFIEPKKDGRPNIGIYSNDRSWHEVIEYQVADFLDVRHQLIDQRFPMNWNASSSRSASSHHQVFCPTILSARFEGSQLVLSILEIHDRATNVIYGIRCRLCPLRDGACNINYVGKTKKTVHDRVCGQHARSVQDVIHLPANSASRWRPMYDHAAKHFKDHDLSSATDPRNAFSLVMDVILLCIGTSDDLSSWELFWQFFCQCREFFLGWSQR